MYLVTYKVFGNPNAKLFDYLIAIATLSNYSHSELEFDNGEIFSISPRSGTARFTRVIPRPTQRDGWDSIRLPITTEQEKKIRLRARMYLSKKYDYLGAIGSVIRLVSQNPNKYFCSELCATMINPYIKLKHKPSRYTPARLKRELT